MTKLAAYLALALAILPSAACKREPPPPVGSPPAASAADPSEAAGLHFEEHITGGARASDRLPLLIAIHGRGGRPERFGHVLSGLTVPARVILPYAPDPLGPGFTWFPDWRNDVELAAGSRHAADRLAAMIAELVARRPTAGKAVVTGFSQGGILSFTLAVLHPEAVRAAFPISGLLAPPLWPSARIDGAALPPVHAFHGTADDLLPIEGARATVHRLADMGYAAELTEYPGVPHTVDRDMQRDVLLAIEQELQHP